MTEIKKLIWVYVLVVTLQGLLIGACLAVSVHVIQQVYHQGIHSIVDRVWNGAN